MLVQKRAALLSLGVSIVVLSLKFLGYYATNSTAILSDALETIANVVTALVALIVIKFAMEPADDNHPYGHGKLEYFSAAFEGGIILFAALAILFESTRSLIKGTSVHDLQTGLIYVAVASAINAIAGFYLIRVGRQKNSETLKASGSHLMADVKTTAGVVLGLVLYEATGLKWIDPAVGIAVGLWLGWESTQIIKKNIGGLLDEADLESVDVLTQKMNNHLRPEIIDIHNLRIIRSGSFHHIDAHLVVPYFLDIQNVHELIDVFEKQVVNEYPFEGEFAFHTDPCYQNYCRVCEVKHCTVRKTPFQGRRQFTQEHVIHGPQYTEKH